ncbi:MAG: hypothetical protein K0S07_1433 [Chlamydiales bacterium]|jgi:zinc transporter ZupT|nr:hypothetical protein [Chlamydiales bacterium]
MISFVENFIVDFKIATSVEETVLRQDAEHSLMARIVAITAIACTAIAALSLFLLPTYSIPSSLVVIAISVVIAHDATIIANHFHQRAIQHISQLESPKSSIWQKTKAVFGLGTFLGKISLGDSNEFSLEGTWVAKSIYALSKSFRA